MDPLISFAPDVYRWEVPASGLPPQVGHAVLGAGGVLVFDPPVAKGLVRALKMTGPITALLLTGGQHERAAGALRARLGQPLLYAPETEREWLEGKGLLVDRVFRPSETLPGGFQVVDLPAAAGFRAECAFYRREDATLLVGDVVVGREDGLLLCTEIFGSQEDGSALLPHLRTLVALHPRRILCGHGADLPEGGEAALRQLLARLGG